ncbi:MAG: class I tRNA ligase family protein [Candidatus Paceibacterota bacterium]
MKEYNHLKIEKRWQIEWEKNKVYKTNNPGKQKKMYVLDMFPYPSGAGLHVGHPRGYIGSDVYARMKRMQNYNVLHPMGYDAFGLPAEQYAIEHKIHPRRAVEINVKTFEKQLSFMGLSYDWERRVNTTDPEYYKWTQWIFLQLYNSCYDTKKNKAVPISSLVKIFEKSGNKNVSIYNSFDTIFTAKEWREFSEIEKQKILMNYRLAYEAEAEVNWCQVLGTVLANDEIVNDKDGRMVSERGGYKVEKIKINQWLMRITAYADRLLSGLDTLDWANSIKEIQRNWIGKSVGSEIDFPVKLNSRGGLTSPDGEVSPPQIRVFTTRADTIFMATYVVLAPEHDLIFQLKDKIENWGEVLSYVEKAKSKEDIDRTREDKEKTGVELKGIRAINPANNEELPVWIADYVLAHYGTGAIMAVPMHDERDRDFANTYKLKITDLPLVDAKEITQKVGGQLVSKYKMRDAIFARQRYWGEPIPLYRDKKGILHEVKKLPLELPKVKSYEPTGLAEGPLAGVKSWVSSGYETNTMPGWAGSSFYFLRYMDPKNSKAVAGEKNMKYWKNVDMYVGGAEHATGHLLYARFWHKFLKDIGVAVTEEPFAKMRNQGMILAHDGRKMSKRWGNVVNPDDVVKTYGADTLRLYEMFIGPFDQYASWSTDGIIGPRRFLERVWKLQNKINKNTKSSKEFLYVLHNTINKISLELEDMRFNTCVSSLMILVSEMEKLESLNQSDYEKFLKILAPFAPHITEELWTELGNKKSIHVSEWPKVEKKFLKQDTVKIVVQVNGKVRTEMLVDIDESEESVKNKVLKDQVIEKFLSGQEIKRVIYVKNRLINIVV